MRESSWNVGQPEVGKKRLKREPTVRPYDLPEYFAFLSGIAADLDNDLPRLVFADWLEENGEAERAELIRIQCEASRLTCTSSNTNRELPNGDILIGDPCNCAKCVIEDRAWVLVRGHRTQWVLPGTVLDIRTQNRSSEGWGEVKDYPFLQTWTRGFISGFGCDFAIWREHGFAIRSHHFIKQIELFDVSPEFDTELQLLTLREWRGEGERRANEIPAEFIDYFPEDWVWSHADGSRAVQFMEYGEAHASISDACMRWPERE